MKVGDLIPIGGSGNVKKTEVLTGKTYSSDEGVDLVGTMPNRGTLNRILTKEGDTVNLSSGYYSSGSIKTQITNLTASNIKKGVTVGGITGDYSGYTLTNEIPPGREKEYAKISQKYEVGVESPILEFKDFKTKQTYIEFKIPDIEAKSLELYIYFAAFRTTTSTPYQAGAYITFKNVTTGEVGENLQTIWDSGSNITTISHYSNIEIRPGDVIRLQGTVNTDDNKNRANSLKLKVYTVEIRNMYVNSLKDGFYKNVGIE